MSDLREDRPAYEPGHTGDSKVGAVVAWCLYILSIPSANLLVLVGLVVAYAMRGSATGVARAHFDEQIRLFWSVFWWSVAAIAGILVSIPLMVVGIGFITLPLCGLAWLVLHIWFTVKSIIGLVALADDRAP